MKTAAGRAQRPGRGVWLGAPRSSQRAKPTQRKGERATAGPAKGPAWQCAAPSCSCGGPFSVFSTDLESPGQGAPARLGPQSAIVRLRRRLAYRGQRRFDGKEREMRLRPWIIGTARQKEMDPVSAARTIINRQLARRRGKARGFVCWHHSR